MLKQRHWLVAVGTGLLLTVLNGTARADEWQTYDIPIYVQGNEQPSNYWIYVSQSGGAAVPYLFDTGSPNMFTVQGSNTAIAATGTFAFGDGDPVYGYYVAAETITLTGSTGTPIVSTAQTFNVAKVVTINGNTVSGNALQDNTYGDFGAGMYGTTGLGSVLAALPIGSSAKVGWIVDAVGLTTGQGTLTVGLTDNRIAELNGAEGAIKMRMVTSGDSLLTATGTVAGYNKAAVNTTLTVSQDGTTVVREIPTVFDTGGGPNGVIYDSDFAGLDGGFFTLEYEGQVFTTIDGTTPWGGTVDVISNQDDEKRVNPGGFLYQNYTVMFNLTDGELTLVPNAVPEPSTWGLLVIGVIGFWVRQRVRKNPHSG